MVYGKEYGSEAACATCDEKSSTLGACCMCAEPICAHCASLVDMQDNLTCDHCANTEEVECACVPLDVDLMDNSGCLVHGGAR